MSTYCEHACKTDGKTRKVLKIITCPPHCTVGHFATMRNIVALLSFLLILIIFADHANAKRERGRTRVKARIKARVKVKVDTSGKVCKFLARATSLYKSLLRLSVSQLVCKFF